MWNSVSEDEDAEVVEVVVNGYGDEEEVKEIDDEDTILPLRHIGNENEHSQNASELYPMRGE